MMGASESIERWLAGVFVVFPRGHIVLADMFEDPAIDALEDWGWPLMM